MVCWMTRSPVQVNNSITILRFRSLGIEGSEKNKMNCPEVCPLCSATPVKFKVVGEHVYGGRSEQKFYECPNCDVAFIFPPITEEEEVRFYAQEFEKFMEKRAGNDGSWSGPEAHIRANQVHVIRRMPFLETYFSGRKLSVIEIGCSSGFMLQALHGKGMDVIGVEPSGGFTSFIESQGIPVYRTLEEFQTQSDAAGNLDLVIHFFVLEHIRHPIAFLERCLSILKPSGKVFFEVPSRDDPLITIYNIPAFHEFYWSVAHHWYFNYKSLQYICNQLPCRYELIPEQRYDLSNHIWWALTGKPGGMGKYSDKFIAELEIAYKESMKRTMLCDTFFVLLSKNMESISPV